MIYRRCPHCNGRVLLGEKCGCGFKREYSSPEGTRVWYHTARWTKLRALVMAKYNGIDQYALSQGRLERADTVHHIIPAEDDPAMFWMIGNLIPVSRRSHDEIHSIYRKDNLHKNELQHKLKLLIKTEY